MSERGGENGGLGDDPDRGADEALGVKISQLLSTAGILSASENRPDDEAWDLGRLVRAFVGVEDPRIRTEIISLLEAISLYRSGNHTLPRH
jgi:hypothetical protein